MARGAIIIPEAQRSFLLSPAAKDLRPNDAAKIKPDEAWERFEQIRFGWTGGLPQCPKCQAEKPYVLRKNGRVPHYRCRRGCGDFSLTVGTCFSSRKAPLSTIIHGIAMRIHDQRNILQTSYELGITYKTAFAWAKSFRLLLGNVRTFRTQDNRWPFQNEDRGDANKLVALVNGALPRGLPEQIRADVAQDMILGVLSGEIDEQGLEAHVRRYMRHHFKTVETPYLAVSLNQPVPGTDDRSWGDVLSTEMYQDRFERY